MKQMENQTLEERVDRVLRMLKCVPTWYDTYYAPAEAQTPNDSPVDILWDLLREGGTLCMVLNADKRNIAIPVSSMDLSKPNAFMNAQSKKNVFAFLGYYNKMRPQGPTFTLTEFYSDDEEPFQRTLGIVEDLLLETNIDFQAAFAPVAEVRALPAPSTNITNASPAGTSSSASPNSGSGRNKSPAVEEKTMKERVIDEILSTERMYVKDLQTLQRYAAAVQQGEHALSKVSVQAIFSNLDALLKVQQQFLQDLTRETTKPPADQSMGSFFLEAVVDSDSFREYSRFCSNYPSALEHVSEISEQLAHYDGVIKESQLHWYLIKPIQRICKYPLLLRELLKHTAEGDAERDAVSEALAAVKKVADNVNEEHRKGENAIIAKDLVKRLAGPHGLDLGSLGKLLLVEPLTVSIQQSEQEAIVYLFEQHVLFCREALMVEPGTRKKVTAIHLKTAIESRQLVTVSNFSRTPDFYRLKCLWQDGSEVLTLFLNYKNEEALMRWLKTFLLLLSDLKAKKKAAAAAGGGMQGIVGRPFVPPPPSKLSNGSITASKGSVGAPEKGFLSKHSMDSTGSLASGNSSISSQESVGPTPKKSVFGSHAKSRPTIDKAQEVLLGKKSATFGSTSVLRKRPKDMLEYLEGAASGTDDAAEALDRFGDDQDMRRPWDDGAASSSSFRRPSTFDDDRDLLEGGGGLEDEKRPSILAKATHFFQRRPVSVARTPSKLRLLDEGRASSRKAEQILLGTTPGNVGDNVVKKSLPKDIFAWLDEEIEHAEADADINDSFLRKHFVTSSMLEGDAMTLDPTGPTSARRSSNASTMKEERLSDAPSTSASSIKSSIRAKLRYQNHVWLIPFPTFSTLKPYHVALREVAASRMKENALSLPDLTLFSESFEPVHLIAARLNLYYIDGHKDRIRIESEDDFWLCMSDATNDKTKSMSFEVKL